jgi:catechol 2,3-dioxygenase-like lactoylglutathione lyase family enzyme
MPTRFDHAVIAVRDLDTALFAFQRLGFDARPGGRHDSGGTHNGLIRFGLDYFELLSVYDEDEARASNRGQTILDALDGREASLVSYALATDTIDEDARRFVDDNSESYLPHPMQRTRPDGRLLAWRVYAPGENSWNRSWPFLIQWDIPDALRLQIDLPGEHANGAIGWTRICVAVHDLNRAREIYQNQLGLVLIKEDAHAQHVAFGLGEATIDLFNSSDEDARQRLAEAGEGPFALYVRVRDLHQTRAFFAAQAIPFILSPGTLLLDASETLGTRIFFIE